LIGARHRLRDRDVGRVIRCIAVIHGRHQNLGVVKTVRSKPIYRRERRSGVSTRAGSDAEVKALLLGVRKHIGLIKVADALVHLSEAVGEVVGHRVDIKTCAPTTHTIGHCARGARRIVGDKCDRGHRWSRDASELERPLVRHTWRARVVLADLERVSVFSKASKLAHV